jgi:hypothetical protein
MRNETIYGSFLDFDNNIEILYVTFREIRYGKFYAEELGKESNHSLEIFYRKEGAIPSDPNYTYRITTDSSIKKELFNKILTDIENIIEESITVFTRGHFHYI